MKQNAVVKTKKPNSRNSDPAFVKRGSKNKHSTEAKGVKENRELKAQEYEKAKALARSDVSEKNLQDPLFIASLVSEKGQYNKHKGKHLQSAFKKIDLVQLCFMASLGNTMKQMAMWFEVSEATLSNQPYATLIRTARLNRVNKTLKVAYDLVDKGDSKMAQFMINHHAKIELLTTSIEPIHFSISFD